MSTDPPIACSLSATELPERLAEMKDLSAAALLTIRSTGTRSELRFAADAMVRERLEAIVANEARCCPFLNMRLSENAGVITLYVEAPEGAEIAMSEIAGAFGDRTKATAR
jgi:hypothetical protein